MSTLEISSISEQLLFTVVRIETKDSDGNSKLGTGFILSYEHKNERYLFLVTCKHIVKGAQAGALTFILGKEQKPLLGHAYRLEIKDFENMWFLHKNETIDVAVSPFVPIVNHISEQGVEIYFKSIPNSLIPNQENLEELDAIEEVIFVGYPAGLWDPKNFLPIIRKGITATPVFLDFKGEKQFLIDASVFPGSSGSPVFIFNKGVYWDKKSGATVVGNRIFFLGMLSAVFTMHDTGEIIFPLEKIPTIKISQMLDIGIVFKAEAILEAIKEFLQRFEK